MHRLGIILAFFASAGLCAYLDIDGVLSGLGQQDQGASLVPWLQPLSWKPTYAGDYNDLEKLLKSRASNDGWITLFCFSMPANRTGSPEELAFMRMALNAFYTYQVFGEASSDIVAALTPAALAVCQSFRLPCFDASKYAKDARTFKTINWAKIKLARDILNLGYHVHLSDVDVSYLKPIQPARNEIFSWSNGAADCSLMQEEWVHQDNPQDVKTRRPIYLVNTGVVFLRANPRSVAFLESMLKYDGDQYQEQYVATLVAYNSWAPCTDEASCLAARSRGLAAVQVHPNQFAEQNCMPEPGYSHCAPRRLYVHAICRATAADKEGFLRFLKAFFISRSNAGAGAVVLAGSGGAVTSPSEAALEDAMLMGQQDNNALSTSGLPCPAGQQRAWIGYLAKTVEAAAKRAKDEAKAKADSDDGALETEKKEGKGVKLSRKRGLASRGGVAEDGVERGGVMRLRGFGRTGR